MCLGSDAAVERVFKLLGKRWTGLVIASLMSGPVHFSDLRRTVPGISERMLSDRLTELQTAALVVREVHEGPPLRVAYHLTDAGRALRPAMEELRRWAESHLPADGGPCVGGCD
ncbi:winged helix-turn-helix transcriptional regulator [Streptacidiphilus fuscans]|uniref:Helix-turn-helix transcriptional regulator n=1 Tax=Streptacidiphilus fuscans TaxID=2789292 RepID=A0A931B9P9_9ACTN|nr:helix-turn-helix domain-containing protein [Streptacidiphilus fuscans]MBF9069450.1 helix-turn-helix transcriptional regulator [Streptacidiphilus fuscans]